MALTPEEIRCRNRECQRARVQARKAAGVCAQCGVAPRVNATFCERCREAYRAAHRRRYRQLIAAGKCRQCQGSPLVTKYLCARCNGMMLKGLEARQLRRARAGLCVRCGRVPPTSGAVTCADCQRVAQEREKRARDAREAATGYRETARGRANSKAAQRALLEAGRCTWCREKNPAGGWLCPACRPRLRASVKRTQERNQARWEAEGRCNRCGGEKAARYARCKRCRDYLAAKQREYADRKRKE